MKLKQITTLVFAMLMLVIPARANATTSNHSPLGVYKPAPQVIVDAGKSQKPRKKTGVQKRAWIVCRVWGKTLCVQALNVAWCESGLNPYARNGNFMGIFQMGKYERERFGHGHGAWAQAKAAKKYYSVSGWTPWECQPYPRG